MKEIKTSGECVNTFDLFSIENRMGRWAGQTNMIYNALGQISLNIFNSRSIIYVWTAVIRRLRKRSLLHIGLIKYKMSALLDVPFEKDKGLIVKLSKANGICYLVASYLKYNIEKLLFLRKMKLDAMNKKG